MFWIRFFIGGFIIAIIPWVDGHFNNRLAGYLVALPVIFTLSFLVQYYAHGNRATINLIQGSLLALPALLVFGLISIFALQRHVHIGLSILLSILGWFITVLLINRLIA